MHHKHRHFRIPFDRFPDGTNEFEIKIRSYIRNELNAKTYRLLQLLIFVIAILLFRNMYFFEGEMLYVFFLIIAALTGLLIFLNTFKHKQKDYANILYRTINFIKQKNYNQALDLMLNVYEQNKDEKLWEIIDEFTNKYPPTNEQNTRISLLTMDNKQSIKSDPKLKEILEELKNVTEYIKKHNDVIAKSRKKIADLSNQIRGAVDMRIKNEYQNLIKRYYDIIELENSKIQFYEKARNELLKLKESHLITQKLLQEKAELETLENNLLEKSISEAYNSDMTVDDFINYETSYLEAIKEYSETVSTSSDKNLFEEVIRKFNDKTELLNND